MQKHPFWFFLVFSKILAPVHVVCCFLMLLISYSLWSWLQPFYGGSCGWQCHSFSASSVGIWEGCKGIGLGCKI